MCFAFKGPFSKSVTFLIKYRHKNGYDASSWRSYPFTREQSLDRWDHKCVNVYDEIMNDKWLPSVIESMHSVTIERIRMQRDAEKQGDTYIDDVWIGSEESFGESPSILNSHRQQGPVFKARLF